MVAVGYIIETVLLEILAAIACCISGYQTFRVYFFPQTISRTVESHNNSMDQRTDGTVNSNHQKTQKRERIGVFQRFMNPLAFLSSFLGVIWLLDARSVYGLYSLSTSYLIGLLMRGANFTSGVLWATEVLKISLEYVGVEVPCLKSKLAFKLIHSSVLISINVIAGITTVMLIKIDRMWVYLIHTLCIFVTVILIILASVFCWTQLKTAFEKTKSHLPPKEMENHLAAQAKVKMVIKVCVFMDIVLGLVLINSIRNKDVPYTKNLYADPEQYSFALTTFFVIIFSNMVLWVLQIYISWIPLKTTKGRTSQRSTAKENITVTVVSPSDQNTK
jgi:hypothetical protein